MWGAVSRLWSLPTWDKPATPCLASRIRHGIEVTPYRLARVDRAEAAAREILVAAGVPVTDLRVRDLGGTARIEDPAAEVAAVAAQPAFRDCSTAEIREAVQDFRLAIEER